MLAGCALVGGETAEHPGLLGPDEYDVAGAGTGVVEADELLGPGPGARPATCWSRWRPAACTPTATRWPATCCSTGPAGPLDRHVAELGRTLGEELLEPTRIYAPDCLALIERASRCTRSATSPAAGWPRTWPGCCRDTCRRPSSARPGPRSRSSGWSRELGGVDRDELERTFNMGVGMVAVVAPDAADRAVQAAGCARRTGLGAAARWPTATEPSPCRAPTRPDGWAAAPGGSALGDPVVVLVLVVSRSSPTGRQNLTRALVAAPRSRCPVSCTSARARPWSASPWLGRAPWLDPLIRQRGGQHTAAPGSVSLRGANGTWRSAVPPIPDHFGPTDAPDQRLGRGPAAVRAASIRRSASRSAAVAGEMPSSAAAASTRAVVSKIVGRLGPRALEGEAVQLVGHLDHAAGVHAGSPGRRGCRASASSASTPGWASWLLAPPQTSLADSAATTSSVSACPSAHGRVDVEVRAHQRVGVGHHLHRRVRPRPRRRPPRRRRRRRPRSRRPRPGGRPAAGRPCRRRRRRPCGRRAWGLPTGARRRPACPGRRRTP